MRLFDKLLKRNPVEEKIEEVKEPKEVEIKREPTFKEQYPDGLPLKLLKGIEYKNFGAILKQKQLLPPSYDRKPASVNIELVGDIPRIKLIFKSKTSESYCTIAIYRYDVSYAKKDSKIYQSNYLIGREWEKFCARITRFCERGYTLGCVNTFFNQFNQINLTDEELGL